MFVANSAKKSSGEYWRWVWQQYQKDHPGPFRFEDLVEWATKKGLIDMPKINPKKLLIQQAKRAARESRINDKQGRRVREMLPAKIPIEYDEHGNMLMFEVRYDHIHAMSADHALLSFDQRDDNINKQKKSATRDLISFLENNPNAVGREGQFVFDFLADDPEPQVVEKLTEDDNHKPR